MTTGRLGRPAPESPGDPVQHIAAYVERYEPGAERLAEAGTTVDGWRKALLGHFEAGSRKSALG